MYKSYKFIRQPNVAVGRIGLVYSKPDNAQLFVNYYDLPNLYVSGWSVKNLLPKQSSALKTYARQEGYEDIACIQEASRLLKKDADVTYVTHLTKIFKSLFRPQISLEDIHRDLHHRFTQTYQLLEQLSNIHYLRSSAGNAIFSSRFYDTEQAIFYDIIKQINTLIVRNTLFENVPAYSTIHLFSLDIASYLDMCFDCGDTAFCQTKGVSGFAKEVRSMFYGLNGSYEYAQSFEVFIKVSSQHRCVDTDWDSRGDQTNYEEVYNTHHLEDVAPLESRAFGSYIAQLKVDK